MQEENKDLHSIMQAQSSDAAINFDHLSKISESIDNEIDYYMIENPQPTLPPPMTFELALQQLCPRKSSTLTLPPWNNESKSSYNDYLHNRHMKQITTLLRFLSSDNKPTATDVIVNTLNKISDKKDITLNEIIVNNISTFMDEKLINYEHSTIEAKCTIIQATLGSDKSFHANVKID